MADSRHARGARFVLVVRFGKGFVRGQVGVGERAIRPVIPAKRSCSRGNAGSLRCSLLACDTVNELLLAHVVKVTA